MSNEKMVSWDEIKEKFSKKLHKVISERLQTSSMDDLANILIHIERLFDYQDKHHLTSVFEKIEKFNSREQYLIMFIMNKEIAFAEAMEKVRTTIKDVERRIVL